MPSNLVIYTTVQDQKTLNLHSFLSKHAPCPVQLNPSIKSIKNSTVFISGFNRGLLSLDASNKIIMMTRKSQLGSQDFLLLPMVDVIISNTQYEAIQLSWQLRCKGFKTRVTHLLPWYERSHLTQGEIYCPDTGKYAAQLVNQTTQRIDPKAQIRMCLTPEKIIPDYIIEGMVSGAICIALDQPPFNELITHGHNGYLIRNPGDLVDILENIRTNKAWVSNAARASMSALLKPTRYLDSLLYPEKLSNINHFEKTPKDYSERSWLVRERSFNNGKLSYSPTNYSKDFNVIDLSTIEEVLSYFLTQEFSHVYVFGCELSEILSSEDEVQLQRIIIKMGKRSLRVHFCRDKPVPPAWKRIFTRLSTISVEEGLKQVAN
jgi:hypothetical protein